MIDKFTSTSSGIISLKATALGPLEAAIQTRPMATSVVAPE